MVTFVNFSITSVIFSVSEDPEQLNWPVISCEVCEIFKNTCFCRTPAVAGSRHTYHSTKWEQERVLREAASLEVKSIQHGKNQVETTWRTHRCFIDFESQIDEILTNSRRGISMSNRWGINKDVYIGVTATYICSFVHNTTMVFYRAQYFLHFRFLQRSLLYMERILSRMFKLRIAFKRQ